jgi:hypothetical protein
VVGLRSSSSGLWQASASAPQEGDQRPPVAIPAPLPPARGTVASPRSSPTARHQVSPWGSTARSATTRSPPPWGAAGEEAPARFESTASLSEVEAKDGSGRSLRRRVDLLQDLEWMLRAVPELEVEGEGGGTGRDWRQGDWRGSRHGELRSDFRRRSVGRRCNYGAKTARFAANHES